MRRALALLFALTPFIAVGAVCAQTTFVVRDVRLFDGERVTEHRSVLVRDGRIAQIGGADLAVPANTEAVDGRGRTLIPGLIDAHVHVSDNVTADLRQAASLGVTTVLDMFSAAERFERIKAARSADAPNLADVRTAGVGATAPGGHPTQMGGGPPFPTVARASEAASFIDARVAEGSDFIKIIYDDLASLGMSVPMLDRETLRSLISAVHARGKLAVVHILTESQARTAIEEGADGLVHLFASDTVSPDFAKLAATRRAFVIPTLSVVYSSCRQAIGASIMADTLLAPYVRPDLARLMTLTSPARPGAPTCRGTREAIRQLSAHGVSILAGTDAPAPGRATYGSSLHGELSLLVEAGLTPVQALAAATSLPARAFGLTDRGRISPGMRADLVLVDGDPTTDILASRRIVMLWKRGTRVERLRYGRTG